MANTNFVPSLLIGNGTDAAPTALSAQGDIIMVLAEDHTQILTAAEAAALGDNTAVQFLQYGNQDGTFMVRQSVKLTRKGVEHYAAQNYTAASQKQVTVDDTAIVADNKYKFVLVMTPDNDETPNRPKRYEFTTNRITAGNLTVEMRRVVKFFNTFGPIKGFFTATWNGQDENGVGVANTAGLVIKGNPQVTRNIDDYAFVDFDLFVAAFVNDGTYAGSEPITESGGSTVTSTIDTYATPGGGLAIQVRAMERFARGYEGMNNLRQFDVSTPVSEVTGATYDILVIEGRYAVEGDFQFLAPYPAKVQFAIPTAGASGTGGSAQRTQLEALISGWLYKQTTTVVEGE